MIRLTLTGAALIAVSYGLARFALGLFAPELRAAHDLSGAGVGAILAASYAGFLVALALAGHAIDRAGARAVALAGGLCATLGTAGVAAAPNPLLLALAAGLGGLSTGWATTALANAVEAQLAPRWRAPAQTAVNAGTSLGLIVAAPVAVLAGATWRAAWLGFAALAAIATIAATSAVRPERPLRQDRPVRQHPRVTRHQPPHPPDIGGRPGWRTSPRLALTAVVLGASSAAFWAFGRELLAATTDLTDATSQLTWLAVGTGGLAGALAGVAARRNLAATLAVSWAGFAVAHAGLASGRLGMSGAVVMAGLFGACYMALTGLLIVWAVRENPARPGAAVGAAFLVLAAGQIVGSPLAGVAVDTVGLQPTFAFAAAVAAVGLALRPADRTRRPTQLAGATPATRVLP